MNTQRMRLKGGLEHTVTWVEVLPDGGLLVELYDHSEEAERWFGNDVAFLLEVKAKDIARVKQGLLLGAKPDNEDLLEQIQSQFADYYAFKQWLASHQIPFQTEFDSRA
jgi:hypothetical protein